MEKPFSFNSKENLNTLFGWLSDQHFLSLLAPLTMCIWRALAKASTPGKEDVLALMLLFLHEHIHGYLGGK